MNFIRKVTSDVMFSYHKMLNERNVPQKCDTQLFYHQLWQTDNVLDMLEVIQKSNDKAINRAYNITFHTVYDLIP